MAAPTQNQALTAPVPLPNDSVQSARVERLHDWFGLQLHFAEVFVSKTGLSPAAIVTFYTNLHRRFGFGRPARGGQSPEWDDFVQQVVALPTLKERIEYTKVFAQARLGSWSSTTGREFGCFSFDAPRDGIVRIHFAPNDKDDGIGPLSHLKYARRTEELREMFAFIRNQHPASARQVAGGSWLYNLEAYRRLFPSGYLESLRIHTSPSTLAGGSWWGQFLDHDEIIVAERAGEFSRRLPHLDPTEAWRVFPMPAMNAHAQIDVFHEHYASSTSQPKMRPVA